MRNLLNQVGNIASIIAVIVFVSGIILTGIGIYELVLTFKPESFHTADSSATIIAIGLLKSLDMFLIALVFFIFSVGVYTLFSNSRNNKRILDKVPEWLMINSFIKLKVILWETILTTFLVSYLAGIAEKKFSGEEITVQSLIIPAAIVMLSISMVFLKKES
ncbi:YqhA family protein [Flavobacterium alkalisoli]|uniref:YqhA family protein n=1 Tax=Flavobacterium alkalisoli TaxID=2602769 RepID=A0A5B9FUB9_9FLAO|nr:YqhA family protein [Flavobacterium alkalisoli]QEE49859.1 YqhA family protein [Flavobacterium alkalisoli]